MGGEKPSVMEMLSDLMGSPPRRRGKDAVQRHATCGVGITPAWAGKRMQVSPKPTLPQDHPRVDGEKCFSVHSDTPRLGSPPRRRGKGVPALEVAQHIGITPAWAGKRWRRWYAKNHPQDHPRVGGEKHGAPASLMWSAGSPPRGRGKAGPQQLQGRFFGITPAWAGKSIPAIGVPGASMGSPPRGRGKECRFHQNRHCRRITPAWTGKRFWNRPWVWATSDHPRVGGEKP